MSLTKEQIDQFTIFGFVQLPQLFDPQEIGKILKVSDAVWASELGRAPQGAESLSISLFVEREPDLTELLVVDDRLYVPLCQLLGEDMIWSGSEGNRGFEKDNNSHHWHADRPNTRELGYLRVKAMIYLDPMRKETGAFRVIPGSHLSGFHECLQPMQSVHGESSPTFFGLEGAELASYAVETNPGDVVLFNQNLFHAVYGKTGSRRYIALKYAARPQTDEHLASLHRWSDYAFQPDKTYMDSDNKRLRKMVEGLMDLKSKAATLPYP